MAKIIQAGLKIKLICLCRCAVCVPKGRCPPGAKPERGPVLRPAGIGAAGTKKWRTAPLRSAKKQGMGVKLVN